MAELKSRFARYGGQISKLMHTKGKKWKAINAVRKRQRQCVLKMLKFPQAELSRALQRVAPFVLQDETALREFEDGGGHKIYAQVSMQVRHSY